MHPEPGSSYTGARPPQFDTVGAQEDVGPPDRTVGLDSAVWLVVFALILGGVVGGFVIHSLQPHSKRTVIAGPATVIREPPRTVVHRVTTVVQTTQIKISYVQTYVPPTTTTTPSVPGDLPDSTDPVVIQLNSNRSSDLSTTPELKAQALACAEADAAARAQNICQNAKWSAAQAGRGLTSSGFVRGIYAEPDRSWLSDKFSEGAAARVLGSDGRTYWALVLDG